MASFDHFMSSIACLNPDPPQINDVQVPVFFDDDTWVKKFDKILGFPGFQQWVARMDPVRSPNHS